MRSLRLPLLILVAVLVALAPARAHPMELVQSFFAFPATFPGGVTVADCGTDPAARTWLVTGPASGGGLVRLYVSAPLIPLTLMAEWAPYGPGWAGGVTVSCGVESAPPSTTIRVMTGAGPGGGPHVQVWTFQYQEPGLR